MSSRMSWRHHIRIYRVLPTYRIDRTFAFTDSVQSAIGGLNSGVEMRIGMQMPSPNHRRTCFNLVGEEVGRGCGGSVATVGSCGGRSMLVQTLQATHSSVVWTRLHDASAGPGQFHVDHCDDDADCDRTLTTHRSDSTGSLWPYGALPVSSNSYPASSFGSR